MLRNIENYETTSYGSKLVSILIYLDQFYT